MQWNMAGLGWNIVQYAQRRISIKIACEILDPQKTWRISTPHERLSPSQLYGTNWPFPSIPFHLPPIPHLPLPFPLPVSCPLPVPLSLSSPFPFFQTQQKLKLVHFKWKNPTSGENNFGDVQKEHVFGKTPLKFFRSICSNVYIV